MGNDDIAAKIYAMIVARIKEFGWMIQMSENDDFPFLYTIGLYPKYGFELVVTGIPPEISGSVLHAVVQRMEKIDKFGETIEIVPGGTVRFYMCPRTEGDRLGEDVVCQADNYFGMQVPVVQLLIGTVDAEYFDTPNAPEYVLEAQPLLFTQESKTVH